MLFCLLVLAHSWQDPSVGRRWISCNSGGRREEFIFLLPLLCWEAEVWRWAEATMALWQMVCTSIAQAHGATRHPLAVANRHPISHMLKGIFKIQQDIKSKNKISGILLGDRSGAL